MSFEFFYVDKEGNRHDEALHAEMLHSEARQIASAVAAVRLACDPSLQRLTKTILGHLGVALLGALAAASSVAADRLPNIIHIVADDVGYDDLGCYGAPAILTPNLDQLASRGMRFTSYYAPAPLCSASRAALMTGCYAERVGIPGALMPFSTIGLNPDEKSIAALLKTRGYQTAIIGKWHLGHQTEFLPTRFGFDHFFGLTYPNDQGPERNVLAQNAKDPVRPPLPLFRQEEIIEYAPNLDELPHRFLNDALHFIADHRSQPFFLHFANIETHVPWYVTAGFQGRSKAGSYGDAVQYLDWSVGQIVAQVRALGLERNTLIVFTSDNGMLIERGVDYETTYGRFGTVDTTAKHVVRGGKHTVWEGGVRVPFIASWTGKIPEGKTNDGIVAGFDLYSTFAAVAGAAVPADRVINGRDISPLLFAQAGAKSPHDTFYYYNSFRLGAVRSGKWKLMISPTGNGVDGSAKAVKKLPPPQLFDLEADLAETTDLSAAHPDVMERLQGLAEQARADLGDSSRGRKGAGQREPGHAGVSTASDRSSP